MTRIFFSFLSLFIPLLLTLFIYHIILYTSLLLNVIVLVALQFSIFRVEQSCLQSVWVCISCHKIPISMKKEFNLSWISFLPFNNSSFFKLYLCDGRNTIEDFRTFTSIKDGWRHDPHSSSLNTALKSLLALPCIYMLKKWKSFKWKICESWKWGDNLVNRKSINFARKRSRLNNNLKYEEFGIEWHSSFLLWHHGLVWINCEWKITTSYRYIILTLVLIITEDLFWYITW